MRFAPIASSSSGNCIYVGSDKTHLLVDVGISGKRVESGLSALDISGDDLDGILITHEHIDHIGGLGIISRKYNIPIYATEDTINEIKNNVKLGNIESDLYRIIKPGTAFFIKDIEVNCFDVYHDVVNPVAYRFESNGKRCAIITDTGRYDENIENNLKGLDVMLVETNHDVRMLQMGPYPYQTKMRILSDYGHMSNETGARLIAGALNDNVKKIYLGHLSKENNMPQLAYETVRVEIGFADNKYNSDDFEIVVSRPDEISAITEF